MIYKIHYSTPEDVTPAGLDGRKISFPFSFVSNEFVGKPEEKKHTAEHRIILSITGSRLKTWKLSEKDMVRVLFEYSRRFLKEALSKSPSFQTNTIAPQMISNASHPGECEFDVTLIPEADGFIEEMEIQKRMGFGAT
jgi:hypothetical protein